MVYNVEGLEIEITEQTINQIVEALLSQSERPIQELVQESDQILKQAARQFLAVVEYEKQYISKLEEVLQAKKKWESSFISENKINYDSIEDVKSALRNSAAYKNYNMQVATLKKDASMQQSIKNIYKAGMAFQDMINKALNQDPILTYVSSKGTNVGIYSIPLREAFAKNLLKVDISSDGAVTMRFSGAYSTLEKYANSIDSEIKRLDTDRGIQDKPILDRTYQEVMRRFNKYKLVVPKNKVVSVVLWKHAGDWMKMLPSAKGDINEAYANYYLQGLVESQDNTAKDLSEGSMEENIHAFMSLVAEVDNARGRLLGDISIRQKNGGTLDYAVKSAGASVLSLNSLIEMAMAVIDATDGHVRETMREMRENDQAIAVRRNVANKLTKDDLVNEVYKGVKTQVDIINLNFNS